jgi:hypothetical protein
MSGRSPAFREPIPKEVLELCRDEYREELGRL